MYSSGATNGLHRDDPIACITKLTAFRSPQRKLKLRKRSYVRNSNTRQTKGSTTELLMAREPVFTDDLEG